MLLTLITFEGCPTTSRIVSLLKDIGVKCVLVDQNGLPAGHPFRNYSSPTLLSEETILFGSRIDGEGGCSLALPTDDEIRRILKRV